MSDIHTYSSRDEWIFDKWNNTFDKNSLIKHYILLQFARTNNMFEYENLPETIPKKDLEFILQSRGYVTIAKHKDKLYAFNGGLGGMLDEYYHPVNSIVANPYLSCFKTFIIDKDCILILNDSSYLGLFKMFEKYANLLSEVDISFKFGAINSRFLPIITARDENAKSNADKYINNIIEGKDFASVLSKEFIEDLKNLDTLNYGVQKNNYIKELIELYQFLKASWYNDIGLNANFNMKREAINESEAGLNEDALIPLIDNMLNSRIEGVDKVNKMFGTNISVKLSSSWQIARDKISQSLKNNDSSESEAMKNDDFNKNDEIAK